LEADEKEELRVRGGLVVVEATGVAARAGLSEGDVILAVANREILTLKDFETALNAIDKAKPIHLLVRRGDWVQYLMLRPATR
jgi:serine protease Do